MKKLMILGMIVALVLAMSAVAVADEPYDEGNINDPGSSIGAQVPVTLNVEKFASVNIDGTEFTLTATEAGTEGYMDVGPANPLDITIKANTPISVQVREDLSRNIADDSDVDAGVVEGVNELADDAADFMNRGYAVGVEAWLTESTYPSEDRRIWSENTTKQGVENNYSFGAGTTTDSLNINAVWYGEWQELAAGTYNGTVYVIVSAQ